MPTQHDSSYLQNVFDAMLKHLKEEGDADPRFDEFFQANIEVAGKVAFGFNQEFWDLAVKLGAALETQNIEKDTRDIRSKNQFSLERQRLIVTSLEESAEKIDTVASIFTSPKFRQMCHAVLSTRTGEIKHFIEAEKALLRVSGVHDQVIERNINYLLEHLNELREPRQLDEVVRALDWLSKRLSVLIREKRRHIDKVLVLRKLSFVFGGISICVVDVEALPLLSTDYAAVSFTVGAGMIVKEVDYLHKLLE